MTFVLLPASGPGFRTYNREVGGRDQYGTATTIAALQACGHEWRARHPAHPFAVGDISRRKGGAFPPHKSHQRGTDVDLRPLRADGRNLPCTYSSTDYDRARTRELIKLLRGHGATHFFFNDPVLVNEGLCGLLRGHDNHLHVRFA